MNDITNEVNEMPSEEARAMVDSFQAVMRDIRTEVGKVIVGQQGNQ